MGETKNPTAVMSVTDTTHGAVDCLERDLPDLYPVNCHPKTSFMTGTKSKDMDESSERTNDGSHSDESSHASVSFAQSLVCFIPFLWNAVWAGIYFIQSFILTNLMQTFSENDKWADIKVFRSVASPAAGSSTGVASWPPPALLFFALLTLTVLVVHPDGFTWIALRKLRGCITYLFESSTTCWAWVLNDFGSVVSTVLALTTFASLFFFCYLLHRTLRPRSNQKSGSPSNGTVSSSPTPEKSRKKRKKTNKNRAAKQTASSRAHNSSPDSPSSPGPDMVLDHASSISASAQSSVTQGVSLSSAAPEKKASIPVVQGDAPVQKQKDDSIPEPPRLRIESLSTVDTVSFDVSMEDASVGSGVSGRSTPQQNQSAEPGARNNMARPGRAQRKTRGSQPLRNPATPRSRKSENHPKGKDTTPAVVSRWDALKPGNNSHEVADAKLTKGQRKNTQANASRSPHAGNQSTRSPKQKSSVASHTAGVETRVSSPTSHSSMAPSCAVESLWHNDDAILRTPDRAALMTGFLQDTSTSAGSSLNPRSPSFTPSQPGGGLRPPPGLSPPSHAPPGFDSTPMEPLLLPPTTPPPGLSSTVPGLTLPSGCTCPSFLRPRDNPFMEDDEEEQIAAELQELGGQMVGSVLDF